MRLYGRQHTPHPPFESPLPRGRWLTLHIYIYYTLEQHQFIVTRLSDNLNPEEELAPRVEFGSETSFSKLVSFSQFLYACAFDEMLSAALS